MNAELLFERLKDLSLKNPGDIAVVLDAVISNILNKTSEGKSVEFADFGDFKKSETGKLVFTSHPDFARIINYKYEDMEPVEVSEVAPEHEAFAPSEAVEEEDLISATPIDELVQEIPLEHVVDETNVEPTISFSEETIETTPHVVETQELSTFNIASNEPAPHKVEVSVASQPLVAPNQQVTNDIDVSSVVNEIVEDVTQDQENVLEAPIPEWEPSKPEPATAPEAIAEVQKTTNDEKTSTQRGEMSDSSFKNQKSSSDETNFALGLSNSDLNKDMDNKKLWILVFVGIILLGTAIWWFMRDDVKNVKSITQNIQPPTEVVTPDAAPVESKPVETKPVDPKSTTKDSKATQQTKTSVPAKTTTPATTTKTTPTTKTTTPQKSPVLPAVGGLKGSFDPSKGGYVLNVSSWANQAAADKAAQKWASEGYAVSVKEAFVESKNSTWYRVRIGQFSTRSQAVSAVEELRSSIPDAWVDTAK